MHGHSVGSVGRDSVRCVEIAQAAMLPIPFSYESCPPVFRTPQIVIFDAEWTAWEGSMARSWSGPGEHRELVQIGAVRLDVASGLKEIDSLELLVRPRINPILSDYFKNLTGIRQEDVDRRGVDLKDALDRFVAFAGAGSELFSNGGDEEVMAENSKLYTIDFPMNNLVFANLRPILMAETGYPRQKLDSGGLPSLFGLPQTEVAHNALGDARSIAATLRHLRANGGLNHRHGL